MQAKRKLRGALAGGAFAANVRQRDRDWRTPAEALPRASLLAICAVAAFAVPAVSHAQEAQVQFDIAAGPLAPALGVFGQQAKQQVLFDEADVAGRNARAVKGLLTPRQALERLLEGSGVAISRSGTGGFALRAQSSPPAGQGASLAEVTVAAEVDRSGSTEGTGAYTPNVTRSATRLPLSLRETPQSVTVITSQQIEDRGITGLTQAMETTTGVRVVADVARPSLYSRGLAVSNLQVEGSPMFSGGQGLSNIQSDNMIAYDRIEVLRGANGLLTGPGDPSGTITLVRKRPTREFQAHVQGSLGSWNNWAGEVDVSGPLNASGTVRGRLAAGTYDGDHFIDNVGRDGKALLATVEVDMTPSTVARLGYQHDQYTIEGATSSSAVPLWYSNGQPFNAPRSLNREAPRESVLSQRARTLFVGLEHRFDGGWAFQGGVDLSSRDRTRDPGVFYLSMPTYPNPSGLGTTLNSDVPYPVDESQRAYNFDFQGPVTLFGREHRLMFGASGWDRKTQVNERLSDLSGQPSDDFVANYPTLGAGNWTQPYPYWYTGFPRSKQYTEQNGVFAAARWNLADSLKLITGVRVTNYQTRTDQYNGQTGALTRANANAYSVRREITPYVGAVWDFHPNISAYASYTDIFKPQNLYDSSDKLLEPIVGKNYEAGLKGEFLDKKLNASTAIFRMLQDNLGELDPDYPSGYLTPGGNTPYRSAGKGVTTEGFEADVSGELSRGWNFSAGYTYAKSKKADGSPYNTILPEHLLRVFSTYRFQGELSGLTLGLGGSWNSSISAVAQRPTGAYRANGQPVTAAFDVREGGVLLLAAMARYQFTPQLSLLLNVDNLLDKKYYNSISGATAFYGAPRRWRAALRYQF